VVVVSRIAIAGAAGAALLLASPARATDYGITMDPYAGYLDTVVVVTPTLRCPERGSVTISMFATSQGGKGTSAKTDVAADGTWRYQGALFAPLGPGTYWFVANCYNVDGDGMRTYEPGWSFTVKDGTYWLEGRTPPKPRPSPTTPAPAPAVPTQAATTAPPRTPAPTTAPPTPSPTPTPTETAPSATPAVTASPTGTPTPPVVTLTTYDDGGGLSGAAVGGAAAGGTLLAVSVFVWVRRRRA
jgi:hypothetical protein